MPEQPEFDCYNASYVESLWKEYQRAMVEQANLIPLYQPIYQVGVRSDIAAFPLTAAGWKLDLYGVRRA